MSLSKFARDSQLFEQLEIDKVRLLAFYHLAVDDKSTFTVSDVVAWFHELSLPRPNTSRLAERVRKSRYFFRGSAKGSFRLQAQQISELEAQFPSLITVNEEVISFDTILPSSLYEVNRGYVISLAKQVNASYEHNIFDGCAVLMRRLVEVLLILSYENLGIQSEIQDGDGNYYFLERIVDNAKSNRTLNLSRNTPPCLEKVRKLGNYSAHKVYYLCRKQYIDDLIIDYRSTIENLLYKAGLRT